MEMGSLTHYKISDKRFKQTSYFKDFKRESLYLRWVNDKIRLFLRNLSKAFFGEIQYEDVFWGDKAKELTKIFKKFLNVKLQSNFHNFNNINFGLSSVFRIIEMKIELYYLMSEKLDVDFIMGDDEFQDFFEEFITFTRRIFLKNEEDYEDDIFDINEYRDDLVENDRDRDIENEIFDILDTDTDTDSDSD